MKKICAVCKKEFEGTPRSKYCSDECLNKKIYTEEHVGEIHNELKVERAYRKKSILYAECKCSCGKKCTVRYDCLLNGNTKSCGHLGKERQFKSCDLSNKINKYGVKAIKSTDKKKWGSYVWECKCSCGKIFEVTADKFESVQSCGCAQDKSRRYQAETILKEYTKIATESGTNVIAIMDKKMLKNNTSGIRGVSWDKSKSKWVAQITFKGKNYYLGRYSTIEEAAKIRKIAEQKMFGEFLDWFAEEFPERWKKIKKNKI